MRQTFNIIHYYMHQTFNIVHNYMHQTFNIVHNYMYKTFNIVYNYMHQTFNIVHNYWTTGSSALTFHMCKLSVLIWVQTVCRGSQLMTNVSVYFS